MVADNEQAEAEFIAPARAVLYKFKGIEQGNDKRFPGRDVRHIPAVRYKSPTHIEGVEGIRFSALY